MTKTDWGYHPPGVIIGICSNKATYFRKESPIEWGEDEARRKDIQSGSEGKRTVTCKDEMGYERWRKNEPTNVWND